MYRCKNCNINVDESQNRCPLCGALLGERKTTDFSYPSYNEKKSIWKAILRWTTFLSIAAIAICVFINTFTYMNLRMLWSLYVILSLALAWSESLNWSSRRKFLPEKLFTTYYQVSVFLFCLDLLLGYKGWSLSYALPILSSVLIITYISIMAGSERLYKRFFGYMVLSFFSSMIPAILNLLGLTSPDWLSMLPLLLSILVFSGLYVFSGKKMKREIKKRFRL